MTRIHLVVRQRIWRIRRNAYPSKQEKPLSAIGVHKTNEHGWLGFNSWFDNEFDELDEMLILRYRKIRAIRAIGVHKTNTDDCGFNADIVVRLVKVSKRRKNTVGGVCPRVMMRRQRKPRGGDRDQSITDIEQVTRSVALSGLENYGWW